MNSPLLRHVRTAFLFVVLLLLAHHAAMLLHEWTHGTLAWWYGWKDAPWDIDYGHWTAANVLMLAEVCEGVPFAMLDLTGRLPAMGIIGVVPPLGNNAGLFLLSLAALSVRTVEKRPVLYLFVFLFALANLGNVLCYVPVRAFSTHGDIGEFNYAFGLSPVWVFMVFTLILIWFIHLFFSRMDRVYAVWDMDTFVEKWALLGVSVFILFWVYSSVGLRPVNNEACRAMAWTCRAAIPFVLYRYRPRLQSGKQNV